MFVYSGDYKFCECGLKTKIKDDKDEFMRTGDIVILYSVDMSGVVDIAGVSFVVRDKYIPYTDGTFNLNENWKYFVMGIRTCSVGGRWHIRRIKKFEDIINGEKYECYRLNYRTK